jgi:hypothetical protein
MSESLILLRNSSLRTTGMGGAESGAESKSIEIDLFGSIILIFGGFKILCLRLPSFPNGSLYTLLSLSLSSGLSGDFRLIPVETIFVSFTSFRLLISLGDFKERINDLVCCSADSELIVGLEKGPELIIDDESDEWRDGERELLVVKPD